MPRVLAVEHESDSGPALLGERFAQLGFEVDVVVPSEGGVPDTVEGYDVLLVMGAAPSVNDDEIAWWFDREVALIRDSYARDVPILGVCFGAQALAVALGGSVQRAPRQEIGWVTIDTDVPELVAAGPWFQWHADAVTPPTDAKVIARNDVCVQAYTVGRHLAVQFHPEVTDAQPRDWAAADSENVARLGIDPDQLLAESLRELPAAKARAYEFVDRFLAHAGIAAPTAVST